MDGMIGKYELKRTHTAAYNKYMQPHIKPTDKIKSTYVVNFDGVVKLYLVCAETEDEYALRDKYLLMSYIDKPKVLTAARPEGMFKIVNWLDTLVTKMTKRGLI